MIVWDRRQLRSGEWVSKRELNYTIERFRELLADKDGQITRALATAAEWRAAHETSERSRELQGDHNRDLVDALRAQNHFFDAFRGKLDRWSDGDRDDAP